MKVFIFVSILVAGISAADYCSPDLCRNNKKHIGCGNKGQFSKTCSADAEILHIKKYITLILDEHNKYRNKVASGDLPRFEPAARMRALTWNEELAYLAELNVRQCEIKHDECRNTHEFNHSGQNLAGWSIENGIIEQPIERIKGMIYNWFKEYKLATMNDINKYGSAHGIGHFTAMILDRSTEVGCAAVEYTNNGWRTIVLGCNYASNNLKGTTIYKSGPTASKCTAGRSTIYTSLCSEKEPINPNQI